MTTDGEHVVINIVDGSQKIRNLARDRRVAVNIVDPETCSATGRCAAA